MINTTIIATAVASGASALLLAACVVPDHQVHQTTEGGFECSLEANSHGGQTEIVAQVFAANAIAGDYALDVTRDSAGGRSEVSQGGRFEIAEGASLILASMNLSGHDAVSGRLTVTVESTVRQCELIGAIAPQ